MIRYKTDVLKALARAGWTQARLKNYGLMGGSAIDSLRAGKGVNFDTLGVVCTLLGVQPGDLVENVLSDKDKALLYDLGTANTEKGV